MAKKSLSHVISPLSVKIQFYSLYKVNVDGSKIYRCKYCYKSRIKELNKIFYRLSGHNVKCYVITKIDSKKKLSKLNISKKEKRSKNFNNELKISKGMKNRKNNEQKNYNHLSEESKDDSNQNNFKRKYFKDKSDFVLHPDWERICKEVEEVIRKIEENTKSNNKNI